MPSAPPAARAVFRVSPLVVGFAFALAVCATPIASGAPYLWLIYLLPLAVAVWALLTRTVVNAEAVSVRRLTGRRRVPWTEIASLRVADQTRITAVLADGGELPLPAVHVRDLPRLTAASGGRLPEPEQE